jgi:hypothetical protein
MSNEVELIDTDKFNSLINAGEMDPNQTTSRLTMSLAERTSFFIINAVLMSICHCM